MNSLNNGSILMEIDLKTRVEEAYSNIKYISKNMFYCFFFPKAKLRLLFEHSVEITPSDHMKLS